MIRITTLVFLGVCLTVVACKESAKKTDDPVVAPKKGDPAAPPGTLAVETGTVAFTATNANLQAAEKNLVPGSLAVELGGSLTAGFGLEGGNPCEGLNPFTCQPNLLKIYLAISKMMFAQARQQIALAGGMLTGLGAGAEGSADVKGQPGMSVEFKVKDAKTYRVFLKRGVTRGTFLDVDETGTDKLYEMTVDSAGTGDGTGPRWLWMELVYRSETDFSMDIHLTGFPCSDNDAQAPSAMVIRTSRKGDVSVGKAMMYEPRWYTPELPDKPTCAYAPTASSKTGIFTDYAGDDTNTTATVYFVRHGITDTASMPDYVTTKFCDDGNFPAYCHQNGDAMHPFDSLIPISAFAEPYCVTGGSDTLTWGTPCESTKPEIKTPVYLPETDWLLPKAIEELDIKMPETL